MSRCDLCSQYASTLRALDEHLSSSTPKLDRVRVRRAVADGLRAHRESHALINAGRFDDAMRESLRRTEEDCAAFLYDVAMSVRDDDARAECSEHANP